MSSKRGKFSPEFKQQLIEAYLDRSARRRCRRWLVSMGLGAETLRNWVKRHHENNPQVEAPLTVSERARLAELEREVRELKLEREFLGKAAAFFAKEYR